MKKEYIVLRSGLLSVSLCYGKFEEVLMTRVEATKLRKGLEEFFPKETYLIFKEVRTDAKKGISINKES